MITYKAMYQFVDGGVHCEVLDFPGALSCADDLKEARLMLADALQEMALAHILHGEPLPLPNPDVPVPPEADLDEPIYLLVIGTPAIRIVPVGLER
jgi:predicted RNase H-like HicB family nuclease